MAVYEDTGMRGGGREVSVLLGDGERVFARFHLNPVTLEPVPLGLEGMVPDPRRDLSARHVFREVAGAVDGRLALSAKIVAEDDGYKLLMVYEGRVVGEMHLDRALRPEAKIEWLRDFQKSDWKYP
ncbi:MAG TPA: hypothetical protein VF171_05050 [Trueperaceae bacterium]